MTESNEDLPVVEQPEPLDLENVAEIAPRDSDIDFDDEQDEDQLPIDAVEALEADVLFDDPEALSDEEE